MALPLFLKSLRLARACRIWPTPLFLGRALARPQFPRATASSLIKRKCHCTGRTASSNFPTTPGTFQSTLRASQGNFSAFVSKLNSSGTHLLYSTYLGGSVPTALGIAVDQAETFRRDRVFRGFSDNGGGFQPNHLRQAVPRTLLCQICSQFCDCRESSLAGFRPAAIESNETSHRS